MIAGEGRRKRTDIRKPL